jgi:hypothetical protein
MKIFALRKIDLVALFIISMIALAGVTVGARLVHAHSPAVSALGPGWTCHQLPFVTSCKRIG